jgi:hypothetical protein
LPAVLAGVAVTPLGLEATFEVFGSIVAALALLVAFEAWRTRPRPTYPATTRASLSKELLQPDSAWTPPTG